MSDCRTLNGGCANTDNDSKSVLHPRGLLFRRNEQFPEPIVAMSYFFGPIVPRLYLLELVVLGCGNADNFS